MPIIEPSASFLHDPDVDHFGTIMDIEEVEGKFGNQLKFIIELEDDLNADGEQQETWAYTSTNYSARSKLGGFAESLLGERPEPLDTDVFLGMNVEVVFEQYEAKDAISNKTVTKEKVVDLLPN